MRHLGSVISIFLLSSLSGCRAPYAFRPISQAPPRPNLQAESFEGLKIKREVLNSVDRCWEVFDADLLRLDILPVFLCLENGTDVKFDFSRSRVHLLLPPSGRFKAKRASFVVDRLYAKHRYYVQLFKDQLAEQLESESLDPGELRPGSHRCGLLFFEVPRRTASGPLHGLTLVMEGILKGEEPITLRIPLVH